jgi:hypothetical protein
LILILSVRTIKGKDFSLTENVIISGSTFWRKNRAWLCTLLTKIVNVFVDNPGTGRDILDITVSLVSAGRKLGEKSPYFCTNVWVVNYLLREVCRRAKLCTVV